MITQGLFAKRNSGPLPTGVIETIPSVHDRFNTKSREQGKVSFVKDSGHPVSKLAKSETETRIFRMLLVC